MSGGLNTTGSSKLRYWFKMFFFKLPQNRHPERSASRMGRVTRRLWRGVEGPRRRSIYPCGSELFNHWVFSRGWSAPTSTSTAAIQARFALALPATCINLIARSIPSVPVTIEYPVVGLRWPKSSEQQWVNEAPARSFDSAPQALCHAMTILWEFEEKHPGQVSAYGTQSWAKFNQTCPN